MKPLSLAEHEKLSGQLANYEKQGRNIVRPRLISLRLPYLPQGFQRGTAKAHVIINEKGDVDQILVTGEKAEIFLPGIEAARKDWQFKPGTVDGKPHPFPSIIPLRFE
ncbi:energy transducer TonB [Prosthecobacter dejongeii]|uniref:Putative cupin superfamily protein n=1 Tax=Prosthecobacter dejongeii TaxID=48465 RepID=A0A7W8DRD4_9BACT|nr:energy transducer TonB [Prosthecobacter dejongeii]MBB5039317.1 putative cupin superfamily protein [Prosthecobacter dejongeii]